MRTLLLLCVLGVTTTASHVNARADQRASPTTVRGVLFDSLNKVPLAGATVWVDGNIETATTDALGRFALTSIEPGQRFIAFSSPTLDSIGIGTLSKPITVTADGNTSVSLAVPSFAGVWRALCADARAVNGDSGIIWGTIRDAATHVRYSGARTVIQWAEMQANAKKEIVMTPMARIARTDSSGTYVACGLPVQTNLLVEANGPGSNSGVLRRAINATRIVRIDFLVSTEMASQQADQSRDRSGRVSNIRPRGTSTLRGMVRDEHQRPVQNASVTSSASDTTVRTNHDGIFIMRDLPAGTHSVEARQIGASIARVTVDLHPDSTAEVALSTAAITELPEMNVTASTSSASRDRDAFESRRKQGFGYALTEKDFFVSTDLMTALRRMPNLTIQKRRNGYAIVPPPSSINAPCSTKIWVDGVPATLDDAFAVQTRNLKAVEWYPRAASAPAMYVGVQACSVLLVWTDGSHWGK